MNWVTNHLISGTIANLLIKKRVKANLDFDLFGID
jgi:hypothetical protein